MRDLAAELLQLGLELCVLLAQRDDLPLGDRNGAPAMPINAPEIVVAINLSRNVGTPDASGAFAAGAGAAAKCSMTRRTCSADVVGFRMHRRMACLPASRVAETSAVPSDTPLAFTIKSASRAVSICRRTSGTLPPGSPATINKVEMS